MDKNKEKELEKEHSNAEKPISLAGAKLSDVLKALLETKPMPKEHEDNNKRKS